MYNQEILHDITKPFVIAGTHKDEQSALADIIKDYVQRNVQKYESIIDEFQGKYDCDFEQFSAILLGQADFEQEDDWMDWKAALEMGRAWKEVLRMINNNVLSR